MSAQDEPSTTPTHPDPTGEGLPGFAPDAGEEDLDNIVPSRGYEQTPMVGIGGSAGGIPALLEFFRAQPADSGMVFVVILHLLQNHKSSLAELLGRNTRMPVVPVTNHVRAAPNHVYVIPPGAYIRVTGDELELLPFEAKEPGQRTAVDIFFRSLADSHGPHATAIVLSGANGDGALGIKRVKERGGLTVAQDPEEAEHAGMPRAAIETGMVDWILRASEIPARLLQYANSEVRLRLPPEEGPLLPAAERPLSDNGEAALRDILLFLRARTGRDFACYKRATILRRIARRMQVNGVEELPAYVVYLRTHPGEAGVLLQDLLISVTNFFRDREAFDAIEALIPSLFRGKSEADSVRVWVPACATGEEAYSFAMLLLEHAQSLDSPPALQVFACDLNDDAIQAARTGRYPDSIAADVKEERLRRFFVKEHNGYRVRRELREMVLFASHDLLKDAPFSRMDLISCRNLLIYLGREAQLQVFDTFHFAMKPGGLLFLGSSEAVDEASPLFRPLDKKHRIYAHQAAARSGVPIPLGPSTLLRAIQAAEQADTTPVVHGKRFAQDAAVPFREKRAHKFDRAELAELHFKLVERYAPPSALVNADHEIVHLSEHAGDYLKFVGGESTMNIVRVVDPALRANLRAALFRAAESNTLTETFDLAVEIDGRPRFVNLRVMPTPEVAPGFLLVMFEARDAARGEVVPGDGSARETPDWVVPYIERELEQVKGHLRSTIEQYEASTEELKASNEELQAMNEELRSATEELETSREELQSTNEELTTVNQEMNAKMDELANANSDLQNLMASTAVATVFLDRQLTIMRYTPQAVAIFNLIPGDIGRPLRHLNHRLDYEDLIADAEQVLRTLVPLEREVSDGEHWFLARLQPYRTLEDHIAGVVVTLVDVTERNRATDALRQSEERMRILIESVKDYAIFTTDARRYVNTWNAGAEAMFGYKEEEILGLASDLLFTPEDQRNGEPEREMVRSREAGRAQTERWHVRKDGTLFYGSGSVMPLRDRGATRGFVKIMRDLTEKKRTEEALGDHVEELTRFNAAAVGRETRMIELKREVNELCKRAGEPARYDLAAVTLESEPSNEN